MDAAADELIHLGAVIGTHGLRGDLKVRPATEESSALLAAREVFIRDRDGAISVRAVARVKEHKGNFLLLLCGLDDINAVQSLLGADVLMRRADLPDLDEEEFYWFELEGMAVADLRCGDLGVIEEVFTTAAHDIYVVRGRYGEVLIPAVAEFVVEIDRDGRRMTVDLPEGLVPENDEV